MQLDTNTLHVHVAEGPCKCYEEISQSLSHIQAHMLYDSHIKYLWVIYCKPSTPQEHENNISLYIKQTKILNSDESYNL